MLIISLILLTDSGFTRVISPFGSSFLSRFFRILLIILPLLVFGKSDTKNILAGRAVGPIFLSTCDFSFFSNVGLPVPCLSTTNATGTSPFIS